jgi:hypothetical protein
MLPSPVCGRPGGPAATRTSTATQGDRQEQRETGTDRTRRQAPRGGNRWPRLHGRHLQARAAGARPESQGRRRWRLVRLGRYGHRDRPERSGRRVAGTRDRTPGSARHPRAARFVWQRTRRRRALGQRALRADPASHAPPRWRAPATRAAPAILHRSPPSPPPAPLRSACATRTGCARLAAVTAQACRAARHAWPADTRSNSHCRSTR